MARSLLASGAIAFALTPLVVATPALACEAPVEDVFGVELACVQDAGEVQAGFVAGYDSSELYTALARFELGVSDELQAELQTETLLVPRGRALGVKEDAVATGITWNPIRSGWVHASFGGELIRRTPFPESSRWQGAAMGVLHADGDVVSGDAALELEADLAGDEVEPELGLAVLCDLDPIVPTLELAIEGFEAERTVATLGVFARWSRGFETGVGVPFEFGATTSQGVLVLVTVETGGEDDDE